VPVPTTPSAHTYEVLPLQNTAPASAGQSWGPASASVAASPPDGLPEELPDEEPDEQPEPAAAAPGGVVPTVGGAAGREHEFRTELLSIVQTADGKSLGDLLTASSPDSWDLVDIIDAGVRAGARFFVQVHSRALNVLLSFETHTPFDKWEGWREVRALPLEAQKRAFRDPATKQRLVEIAAADRLFTQPRHPYTRLLLETIPRLDPPADLSREREPVAGEVPNPIDPPPGCAFHPRCPFANERCRRERPELIEAEGTLVACHAVAEGRLPAEARAA